MVAVTGIPVPASGIERLRELLAVLARRSSVTVRVLGLLLLVTALLAFGLPPRYMSSGTILIEQQELPTELVRSTVTTYADQRVQVIGQRVMTTQNLLDIIRRYDLYADRRESESREKIIDRMRDDVGLRMISADVIDPRSGMPREATIAFAVSYTNRSADLATKVANELVTLYLNENLTSRARLAQDAAVFLQSETDRLAKRIGELEVELARFKESNFDSLPELTQLNLQLLDRNESELRQLETRAQSLDQQRVFLEAQLALVRPNSVMLTENGERILTTGDRLKVLRSQLASAQALYAADHPDVLRLQREIEGLQTTDDAGDDNELQRRHDQKTAELAAAQERYTADHPDVQRMQKELASLRQALTAPESRPTGRSSRPDNPAYIQLRAQLEATRNDQVAVAQQTARLRGQLLEYERKITLAPQIERRYRELSRDYESAQLKYREIRSKQMEAQVAQNLESDRKGEKFTLIEPPLRPERPVSPNRYLILVFGGLLSIGIALAVTLLRESLDPTVRGRRDVQQMFGAEPLAMIPEILNAEELRSRRLNRQRLRWGIAASIVLGLAVLHFMVRPLDSVWFGLLQRAGL